MLAGKGGAAAGEPLPATGPAAGEPLPATGPAATGAPLPELPAAGEPLLEPPAASSPLSIGDFGLAVWLGLTGIGTIVSVSTGMTFKVE